MTRNLAEKDFGQFDLSLIDVKNTVWLDIVSHFALIGCSFTHSPHNEFLTTVNRDHLTVPTTQLNIVEIDSQGFEN